MAGNIGVDIGVVISTASEIRTDNATMKGKLAAVSDSVSALRSSWQSEAANSLATIASKMNGKFAELEKSVESFAKFLDGVADNYTKTEQQAVSTNTSIESMFN